MDKFEKDGEIEEGISAGLTISSEKTHKN